MHSLFSFLLFRVKSHRVRSDSLPVFSILSTEGQDKNCLPKQPLLCICVPRIRYVQLNLDNSNPQ